MKKFVKLICDRRLEEERIVAERIVGKPKKQLGPALSRPWPDSTSEETSRPKKLWEKIRQIGGLDEGRKSLEEEKFRQITRFDGLSPAQWLTGHRQRTNAIAAPNAYKRITDEQLKSHMDRRGREYDRVKERGSKHELEQLHPGDQIWLQDPKTKRWSIEAKIINARSERSYLVTDGVREFFRNRRFIRPACRSTGSTNA